LVPLYRASATSQESRTLGKTTIRPAIAAAVTPTVARSAPLVALLVEDDPADAELIATRLESSHGAPGTTPVHLVHADTVTAACARLRYTSTDVVILDLSLPDAHGLEAVRRIRAAAGDVPVIVLTGRADEAMALEALRAGAQDYVLKPPPDGQTLRRILRYACERQHLLHELDAAVEAAGIAARRWRLLAEVGTLLAATNEPASALAEVARLVVPDAADCVAVYLAGDEHGPAVVEVAHVDGSCAHRLRDRMGDLLSAPGANIDRLLGQLDPAEAVTSGAIGDAVQLIFASLGVASGTVVPIRVGERVWGLLALAVAAGRRDDAADVELGRSLADRIGLAAQQARLLRQTERAVASRDRAVSIVSHDLGNPLTTIQICASALLDPEPPAMEGVQHMAQIIQRSAAWMQQIVQDLLDRSSLDAGQLALNRRPTAVSEVIDATEAMFAPAAAERVVDLVVERGTGVPDVDADPHRLVQVLGNLLSNALKFTPREGRIVLSASVFADEGVRFAVSDTGPGIPPEDLSHVFDWFWHSRREGHRGVGLGLPIAKGLIEAHGGRLSVESEPGHGSTFWFTIPAANSESMVT
jgi:signal transduction histidine kinase/FixJ family two-component response regulator